MVSEAQKRATAKYHKEKSKSISIRFLPNDMKIYDYLQTKENKAGYIKSLIRADMDKNSK